MEKKTTPLKRHPALVQYSRDHHFGLLLTWKIRTGLACGVQAERISNYVLYFFETDLSDHFINEEQFLFSELDQSGELFKRAMSEHAQLRGLIEKIRLHKNDVALLTEFAQLLEKHIRFEERELFGHLQKIVSEEKFKKIMESHKVVNEVSDEQWPDKFWL